MSSVVIYCRSGFENDAAAEINHHAALQGVGGYVKAKPNTGFVTFECFAPNDAQELIKKVDFKSLVFARQWFAGVLLSNMPIEDRVSEVKAAVSDFPLCGDLRVETPDTNEGKELSKFCKKFSTPLAKSLEKFNKLTREHKPSKPVLHVLFLANDTAYVGYSFSHNNSPFFMGIPRLKMPSDAPSRSTLKLDEAFNVFVPKDEVEQRVQPGMRAVDLGACPGGWTYQLVRRGMFVAAIDNGPMNESLMESGQVKHFTEDGFKYLPEKRNINWLVCDMVEKPLKVTNLMLDWIVNAFAKELIFNLKLPMKKRFDSVYECLTLIHEELPKYEVDYELQAKHLYHDREEVTVHIKVNRVPQKLYS
ncbi:MULTISPECIES: 23S rRNA (cytidine(2498)-2'-O)-methyltransferase RlmM [Pseudoalteromonas]|uniref:Ribosomal RNA large subunit methyltransferase M n=1 Tax=Pseudoalteromonas amylolytica TaxID=1859457 RepID=A0A1S1MQM5_9GAMM|nr:MULTISPECIES: 23S rRNA (cytidine(2498)-2'-O)-methyltransferase RlmM [Pseudoalteromonas]MCF6437043.1 23S rRNA (cytidine(2498)-2'-O)-methyltransferase RlmM [Pseudoalteromonas sp. MMG022]OHU85760.1 23S rRNA (cytidine(2498)-2'-O)-methyltransferase RlmM [Pseudoalteromonas sp. JW3]OHU87338.1 23S rRNA (cytidine(2498)-2'-O)-methyltransferase RlmM [Pseudoalteromonas amylolytica]